MIVISPIWRTRWPYGPGGIMWASLHSKHYIDFGATLVVSVGYVEQ